MHSLPTSKFFCRTLREQLSLCRHVATTALYTVLQERLILSPNIRKLANGDVHVCYDVNKVRCVPVPHIFLESLQDNLGT